MNNICVEEVVRVGNVTFVPNDCGVMLRLTSWPVRLKASLDLRTAPVLVSHMLLGCTTGIGTQKLVINFLFYYQLSYSANSFTTTEILKIIDANKRIKRRCAGKSSS